MSDWKYDLDEVGPEGEDEQEQLPPVEKGTPQFENVVFVLVGVGGAMYVLATLLGLA
ncbi:DUF7312 domain-containing protein [Halanaeroarchaeum sulfurireducens]|uniref:DUF7312 domain-containing protein n=1 Tax=Halanaeroarchaeum sulfurireducens TaxID=1604004 RepID=A0A0F7PBV9_9EURY|nr:hypothetical protein [Halanaeroarchaeum sulfurireducens]AKH97134.1 hypothetical protein HLASF_0638 [Halanaeroarchaeum sulfurireducens]ALG81535.1 hypothetical protein HLASA_0634 [Halanaeroarchaeum sulfurireducens]